MSKQHGWIALFALLTALAPGNAASAGKFHGGMLLGYAGGPGVEGHVGVSDFSSSFPLMARLGIGYTSADPGRAVDARRIFIANANNGVPQKSGWSWQYRLDLLYPISGTAERGLYLYGGPRHSRFVANFRYVGANEDFDVTTRQWGVGLGLEKSFEMGDRSTFALSTGVDYFPKSRLYGHDTSYSPDGEDVNPREDFAYTDADDAVNQPELELRIMAGLNYSFGR
jgi:hypothetical protein